MIMSLVLSTLLGCTLFRDNPSAARLAIQYSVAKFSEQSSADHRQERLNNVKRVAMEVKAIADKESTSLVLLRSAVMVEVAKLHLSPADTVLASGLVDLIAEQLTKRIGDGVLKPEDKLVVKDVMDWVIEAAVLSGAV